MSRPDPLQPLTTGREMIQPQAESYTIAEASALTGLHKNTIRMRVKLGQLPAQRAMGKFGEEYRITRQALVEAGLLTPPDPPTTAFVIPEAETLPSLETASPSAAPASQEILSDLL